MVGQVHHVLAVGVAGRGHELGTARQVEDRPALDEVVRDDPGTRSAPGRTIAARTGNERGCTGGYASRGRSRAVAVGVAQEVRVLGRAQTCTP